MSENQALANYQSEKVKGYCLVCGNGIPLSSFGSKSFCGNTCRSEFYVTGTEHLPGGITGTIAELAVANDLMYKGYYVFKALSPNSPIDLIAKKGNEVRMLEVRSGTKTAGGKLSYPRKFSQEVTEIAVYIHKTAEIIYIPVT